MDIKQGQKHYTSTVLIFSQESPIRVLLMHHKKFDKWMPPGGHIEADENPIQAVIREAQEESNIDIRPYLEENKIIDDRAISLPLPSFILEEKIDAHGDHPEHFHIDMVYAVEVPYQEVKHSAEESHDIGWFTEEAMKDLSMFANVEHEIEYILKKLKMTQGKFLHF